MPTQTGGARGPRNRRQGGQEPQLTRGHDARRETSPSPTPGLGWAGPWAPAGLHAPAQPPPRPRPVFGGVTPRQTQPPHSCHWPLALPSACAPADPPHPGPVTNRDQGPFPLPCPAEPSSAESKPGARTCCPLANCRPGIQVAWPEALASQTPCPGSLGESEFVHQVPFSCPRAHSDSARHSTRLPGRRAEREGVSSAQWLGVLRLHAPGQEEKALTVLWAGPFSLVTGSWLREAASALGFPLSSLLPAPPWAGGHPGRQRVQPPQPRPGPKLPCPHTCPREPWGTSVSFTHTRGAGRGSAGAGGGCGPAVALRPWPCPVGHQRGRARPPSGPSRAVFPPALASKERGSPAVPGLRGPAHR